MPFKILIVEDEFLVALDMSEAMESEGFETILARSSEAALKCAQYQKFDMATMDVDLSGGPDGIETAIQLRKEYGIASLFISGSLDAATRQRAQVASPVGFIDKPASHADLLAAVKNFVTP